MADERTSIENFSCVECDAEPVENKGETCRVCELDADMENELWLGGEWD